VVELLVDGRPEVYPGVSVVCHSEEVVVCPRVDLLRREGVGALRRWSGLRRWDAREVVVCLRLGGLRRLGLGSASRAGRWSVAPRWAFRRRAHREVGSRWGGRRCAPVALFVHWEGCSRVCACRLAWGLRRRATHSEVPPIAEGTYVEGRLLFALRVACLAALRCGCVCFLLDALFGNADWPLVLSLERCFGLAEAGERFWFLRGRVAARRQRRWELSWWGHVSWAQPLRDEGCCIAVEGAGGKKSRGAPALRRRLVRGRRRRCSVCGFACCRLRVWPCGRWRGATSTWSG
jgi:hypothetical protein